VDRRVHPTPFSLSRCPSLLASAREPEARRPAKATLLGQIVAGPGESAGKSMTGGPSSASRATVIADGLLE
jgi:hypothetical protein